MVIAALPGLVETAQAMLLLGALLGALAVAAGVCDLLDRWDDFDPLDDDRGD